MLNVQATIKKTWFFGPATGFSLACLVTAVVTIWELIENPGGVFRDSSGTNWNFVYDTALSWFLPTFIIATLVASVAHLALKGLLRLNRKNT